MHYQTIYELEKKNSIESNHTFRNDKKNNTDSD